MKSKMTWRYEQDKSGRSWRTDLDTGARVEIRNGVTITAHSRSELTWVKELREPAPVRTTGPPCISISGIDLPRRSTTLTRVSPL